MASCSGDNDYQSIGKQCLEITKACVNIGLAVKMSLSIGSSFSYDFCSEQNGNPLPAVVKKKKKSPSTRGRDLKRRAAFLHKKAASSSLSNGDSMALDPPLPEFPEVDPSPAQPILSSPSFEPRPLDAEPNDFENNFCPITTQLADNINTLCICQSVPCVCLASKPLSPTRDHPAVTSLKIKKTPLGCETTTSPNDPTMCENCGQPFLDWTHLCGDKNDDDKDSKCESTRGPGPDEDILDLQGCNDVVSTNLLSTQQKQEILEQNCIFLLKTEPINFDLAKFCFSHAKYFLFISKNHPSGKSMQNLVEHFNVEFDRECKKHFC